MSGIINNTNELVYYPVRLDRITNPDLELSTRARKPIKAENQETF